jgi:hypothetical protein
MSEENEIVKVQQWLHESEYILIAAGAGKFYMS